MIALRYLVPILSMIKKPSTELVVVPIEIVERQIYIIRGQKMMLDSDLARLYQVSTKRLNEAVKRNLSRFPEDFMFRLSPDELNSWRSQIATSNPSAKMGLRRQPYAFTEHGVAMLSAVLNSGRAVQMSILIVRAFVKLREILATHKDLAARIEKIEASQEEHASVINILAEEIHGLKQLPPELPKRRIGFA
ncbi:MAG: ORF6N domain-containing protein [Bryobacteraceae bacterium]